MSRRAMSRELQLVKECGLEHVIPADVLRLDFGVLLRSATTVCAAGWGIAILATIERMKVRGIRISPRDTVLLGKSLVDLDRKGVLVRDVGVVSLEILRNPRVEITADIRRGCNALHDFGNRVEALDGI